MSVDRTTLAIETRDDTWHEHGGAPAWSERLTFAFFDDASGFAGIARLRFEPGAQAAEGSVSIFIPEGGFATVLARSKPERQLEVAVGKIRFIQTEAMKKWELLCKDIALVFTPKGANERQGMAAQVELDLTIDMWSPPHGTLSRAKHADELGFFTVVSDGHFEQAGRAAGRLRLGSRSATIDGTAVRVRSWGATNPFASHEARWFTVVFSPTRAFSVRTFSMGARDTGGGWAFIDGKMRALSHVQIDQAEQVVLTLTDDTGDVHTLTAEPLSKIGVREGNSAIALRTARYTSGSLNALGLIESVDDA